MGFEAKRCWLMNRNGCSIFIEVNAPAKRYEYAVLVTDLDLSY